MKLITVNKNQNLLGFMVLLIAVSLPAKAQERTVLISKNMTINRTNIHYKTGGSGPALLLLHGFTLTGEQWNPFIDELAGNYTLIIPDLPGHGRSEPLAGRFRYEAVAGLMLSLLDQLNIERIYGIGHSAGSITLLHMASQNSEIFRGMILIAGGHRLSESGRKLAVEDRFEKTDPAFRDYYLSIHPGGIPQIKALFETFNEMASRLPVTPDQSELSPEVLANIDTPSLLVWGDRDPYFPVDVATELYQSLPDARLWVIPNQRHVPVWEEWGGDPNASIQFVNLTKSFFSHHE